jgi:glutamate 5-kinase
VNQRHGSIARQQGRAGYVEWARLALAGGAGTVRGTGGMSAKLLAARMVQEVGIPMYILNGKDPTVLYDLFDGKQIGTYFAANT